MTMQVQTGPMTPPTADGAEVAHRTLVDAYQEVRSFSEHLSEPLVTEDYVIQSMPDVSPTKWHLAHTSWFFETFVLAPTVSGYRSLHPQYTYLFNSYYNSVGNKHCRAKRGLISRPTVEETYQYRAYVDEQMRMLLEAIDAEQLATVAPVMTLGLHHEQQHQELMLTDIKHVFASNPLLPPTANERRCGEPTYHRSIGLLFPKEFHGSGTRVTGLPTTMKGRAIASFSTHFNSLHGL